MTKAWHSSDGDYYSFACGPTRSPKPVAGWKCCVNLYRSTSISKLKSFDIEECTGVEYRTRYQSTSISKLCMRYRRHFRNFDIEANTSILYLKPTYFYIEVSLHYIEGTSKTISKVPQKTSISKVLLRYRSLFQVPSRSLSNESQHTVSFIHVTAGIFCVFQEYIQCRQASIPFCW